MACRGTRGNDALEDYVCSKGSTGLTWRCSGQMHSSSFVHVAFWRMQLKIMLKQAGSFRTRASSS